MPGLPENVDQIDSGHVFASQMLGTLHGGDGIATRRRRAGDATLTRHGRDTGEIDEVKERAGAHAARTGRAKQAKSYIAREAAG